MAVSTSDKDNYYDLGSFHRPISTHSGDAQLWFDRGLIWSYAFNHEEAADCFRRSTEHDPSCAMAYWGIAYSLGPNYNKPWEMFDVEDFRKTIAQSCDAASLARLNIGSASPVEAALIHAIQYRLPKESDSSEFSLWNQEYADEMSLVYQDFPHDLDVAVLYADALMNLTPWQMWQLSSGEPAPGARTLEAKKVLEKALSQPNALTHPGLLHLYVHLMEMSSTPEAALRAANHLRGLVPDSGHLNHMPTHIDMLCGDYVSAIASNSDAILADEKFLARAGPLNFYTLYRSHDYHFRIYAAMFAGQSKVAINTASQLEASIPEGLLRVSSPPMADWLEGFLSTKMHTLIRFGRWQDILDAELPQDQELYCVTTAMMHYAKGISLAVMGQTGLARSELTLLRNAVLRVSPSRTLFNNKCVDILAVATAMLEGELEYRLGHFEVAFQHLSRAVSLDDNLPYDEPWGWMQPTRHAYGALLLECGRIEDAAAVYAADLGMDNTLPRALQHPNNVWALHGYHECLKRLKDDAKAILVRHKLVQALAFADVPIASSCFCRTRSVTESSLGEAV